jgi:hypothetical protein
VGVTVGNLVSAIDDDPNHLDVYLISLGEKDLSGTYSAPLQTWKELFKSHPEILFILAAGNEGGEIKSIHFASVGQLSNVIVVAASNSSSDSIFFPDSNFGDEGTVSLVAPGEHVKSALYSGCYGFAQGTSPAAAFVAGAVALLKSHHRELYPWQIKERILSSASLQGWHKYPTKTVAGMLNVKAAVVDYDHAVFKLSGESRVCKGVIPTSDRGKFLTVRGVNGAIPIAFKNLRRISRISEDSVEILYSDPDASSQDTYGTRRRFGRIFSKVGALQGELTPSFVSDNVCPYHNVNILQIGEFLNAMY